MERPPDGKWQGVSFPDEIAKHKGAKVKRLVQNPSKHKRKMDGVAQASYPRLYLCR